MSIFQRTVSGDEHVVDEDRVRRYIAYTRWVWFIASAIALVSAAVTAATSTGTLALVIVVGMVVQSALAIPAAWVLPQRVRWARLMLMVLGALSYGAIYSAFTTQAWATLILNLFLASTFGVLSNRDVKVAFATAARERKLGRSPDPAAIAH
ncbi:hypothetical protein BFN03_11020 [Rhodococcus sp. WMMA185]|uniref:hypothetical protein n=1 Tax=Rhodococcus sp. WMMA185 TaxID=679318 RepID=UPI000878B287|nr:hypothetical protein [Rhodococcus sp. WMMA185]AOW93007.1 hypothetical protein BFN03_11020 [Rhodococcus sp. WMMA185]